MALRSAISGRRHNRPGLCLLAKKIPQDPQKRVPVKVILRQTPVKRPAIRYAHGPLAAREERLDLLYLALDVKDHIGVLADNAPNTPLCSAGADVGQREHRLDRFRVAAEGILKILGQKLDVLWRPAGSKAAVALNSLPIRWHIASRNVSLDVQLQMHRNALGRHLAAHPLDRLLQKLAVQLVSDRGNVAGLLRSEDVPRPANLEIAHGDPKTGAQFAELLNGLETPRCCARDRSIRAEQQVAIGVVLVATDPAAELMQIGQPEIVGSIDENRIGIGNIQPRLNNRR